MNINTDNGIPEVDTEDVNKDHQGWNLIDVRRPEEFTGELGHIKGARLITQGPELTDFLVKSDKSQKIIFICRSGNRSGHSTGEALSLGYKSVANMAGGMLAWNLNGFPVER